jgi:hypothetical protein
VTHIVTLAGVDSERLEWIARLYGNADPKYRDRSFLSHLFMRNPIGPSLHAFAVDGERPVGHCCIVRTRARHGADPLPAGKLEALWLEEPYRGRRPDGTTVVRTLLDRLYAFSDECGIDLVHALATPQIGKVIAFTPVEGVAERSLVSVLEADTLPARALAAIQRAVRSAVTTGGARGKVREPTAGDADLVEVALPPSGCWAVVGEDAWDWYRTSPLLRVLELDGCRGLIQLPAVDHEPLRLVSWRADRPSLRNALRLLATAARVARDHAAASLRFQPWAGARGDGALARACRAAGFIPRADMTTIWVRAHDRRLTQQDAVVATPFLYLGF